MSLSLKSAARTKSFDDGRSRPQLGLCSAPLPADRREAPFFGHCHIYFTFVTAARSIVMHRDGPLD
jgi:hypothetical protein